MTDGMIIVCCEYLYEAYILNGVPESHWPDLHQRIAKIVNFNEWLEIKIAKEKKEIETTK